MKHDTMFWMDELTGRIVHCFYCEFGYPKTCQDLDGLSFWVPKPQVLVTSSCRVLLDTVEDGLVPALAEVVEVRNDQDLLIRLTVGGQNDDKPERR